MATRYDDDARVMRPEDWSENTRLQINGVHTEKTVSFEPFASRVVRVLLERGADVLCFVIDIYRRRRGLLVSLRKRLQQQTICRRAAV
jgi:hypothetical protein